MKHTPTFEHFLGEVVNLNKTRFNQAEKSIETMTSFLENNALFGPLFISTSAQGSFRQKTIIRPSESGVDFDVDILFKLKKVDDWQPKDYLNKLADEYKKSERYKEKVDTRGKTRCVTIDYESDFHVDLIPCIELDSGLRIMNKTANEYELTDGEGYAKWFEGRNELTTSQHLTKVVRLLKYLRDIRKNLDIKSILLTTLIGNQVLDEDAQADLYPDVPTSLKTLTNRLNEFLQANASMPEVLNPVLAEENFNRNWTDDKYKAFRTKFKDYTNEINDAFNEEDEEKSLRAWQRIFGEDFRLPADEDLETTKSTAQFELDIVDHKLPLSTIADRELTGFEVTIEAGIYRSDFLVKIKSFESGDTVKAGAKLKFTAKTNVKKPYEVYWQVVNTGGDAATHHGLRGNFFRAMMPNHGPNPNPLVNWESTAFTGKHWIECFIVRDRVCLARSGPFYVNVDNPKVTWFRRSRS